MSAMQPDCQIQCWACQHCNWRRPSQSKRFTFQSVFTATWLLNSCSALPMPYHWASTKWIMSVPVPNLQGNICTSPCSVYQAIFPAHSITIANGLGQSLSLYCPESFLGLISVAYPNGLVGMRGYTYIMLYESISSYLRFQQRQIERLQFIQTGMH